MRSLIPRGRWVLVLFAGAVIACGSGFANSKFASAAAAQGRPGGPWASAVCRLDDLSTCRSLCATQVADACNNAGVIHELQGDLAGANAANAIYSLACGAGSAGACYNHDRFAPVAEERARRSAAGPSAPPTSDSRPTPAYSYRIDGQRRIFATSNLDFPMNDDAARMNVAAVGEQAAAELGCAREAVRVTEHVKATVFSVEGCGKREVYLHVVRWGFTREARGHEGEHLMLHSVGFVPLSRDDPAPVLHELAETYPADDPEAARNQSFGFEVPQRGSAESESEAAARVADWIALNRAGARDLKCPREKVDVEIRTAGRQNYVPIAEGCGHRATYLFTPDGHGYDLTASVAMTAVPE